MISFIGWIVLFLLTLQTTATALVNEWSLHILGERWIKSTAVMCSECLKLVFSLTMIIISNERDPSLKAHFSLLGQRCLPMMVPAVIYSIQNFLTFVVLQAIPASLSTALLQLKILTTAIFMVILMGRKFSTRKWRALLILLMGSLLVEHASTPILVGSDCQTAWAVGGKGSTKCFRDIEDIPYIREGLTNKLSVGNKTTSTISELGLYINWFCGGAEDQNSLIGRMLVDPKDNLTTISIRQDQQWSIESVHLYFGEEELPVSGGYKVINPEDFPIREAFSVLTKECEYSLEDVDFKKNIFVAANLIVCADKADNTLGDQEEPQEKTHMAAKFASLLSVSFPRFRKHLSARFMSANIALAVDHVSNEDKLHQFYIGVAGVLAMVTLSGFSGIYFEKVLKRQTGTELSVWDLNFQLASFSIVFALITIFVTEHENVHQYGIFKDWSFRAQLSVFGMASGGILVALVIKHTDNIIKGFAMSASIILTSLLDAVMFGEQITIVFLIGSIVIITGVFNYNEAEQQKLEGVTVEMNGSVDTSRDRRRRTIRDRRIYVPVSRSNRSSPTSSSDSDQETAPLLASTSPR